MSFKKIYLIRCDYKKKFLDIVSLCLKIISINLNDNSFKFPIITYTKFIGKKPKYRKNSKLVDIFILKICQNVLCKRFFNNF